MAIPQGTKLGRYEIRSLLGAGGMGEVYLADDLTLHRKVAIKVLRADVIGDKERLQRFEIEAFAASSLNHPNILTIYEIGHENEYHFMATEFIDGESLGQRLKRQPVQMHEVLEVGIQVASALAAAHAAGIVHRDIKPDNIMLRSDRLVKVLDFGLAKLSEPEIAAAGTEVPTKALPLTSPGVVMGTARYMSPEQARGLPVDARTDIWSLGVVLYEMVTRQAPFTGRTTSDVIVAVLTTHPPLLTTYRADVPAELERIITKALRKDEEERYQLVKDFGLDLKTLKQRLEFEAELERSGEGRRSGEVKRIVSSLEHPQTAETLVGEPRGMAELDLDTSLTRLKRDTDPQTVVTATPEAGSGFTTPAAAAISHINRLTNFARQRWKALAAVAVFGVVALAAIGVYWRLHKSVKLTDKDTIVLAEFTNTTGDAIFDGALRQGLAAQLEQSPFLSLVSDNEIAKTLALMEKPKDARLTQQLAREVCQRAASKASIEGSVAGFGGSYTLGLKAVNCQTHDVLTEVTEKANGRDQVIPALSKAAALMRQNLGESLATLQKYDVPAEDVTTSSLEALEAYSQGVRRMNTTSDYKSAIPLFERAISLDPNFAMAYAKLSVSQSNNGERGPAANNARTAYGLRQRVSDREKFRIEFTYEQYVTEDVDAVTKVLEAWMEAYPRDDAPPYNLGNAYDVLGEYEKAIPLKRLSLRLNPDDPNSYWGLFGSYVALNRLDEAKATNEEARAHNFDSPPLHFNVYVLAFLQHDTQAMEREMTYLISRPGWELPSLYIESETVAYGGQISRARELATRSLDGWRRGGSKEVTGRYQVELALREALMGNITLAKTQAEEALNLTDDKYVQAGAAIVLGLSGDSTRATGLADDLERRFPKSTSLRFHYLPMIRGAVAMRSGNAAKAVEAFEMGAPYELGKPKGLHTIILLEVYLRGQACLEARQGDVAAAGFQKILDRPGLVFNEPISALAYLGLGRAYTIAGDAAKARTAYQDFFALWKDADPDVPILKEARAEYDKLK